MRFNNVMLTVALILSALIAYLFMLITDTLWMMIIAAVLSSCYLVTAMGISFGERNARGGVSIKIVAAIFSILLFVSNFIVLLLGSNETLFIVINTVLTLSGIAAIYYLVKADQ